jgi:protein-tyrosine phosphatase
LKNILIVCVGNICRSTTAERILKKKLPSLNIISAGISALVGRGIEKNAADILNDNGYDVDGHSAKGLSSELIFESDLVLVMEKYQKDLIVERYPESCGKVFLLGKWSDDLEIIDPYRKNKEVFLHVFNKIQTNCFIWVEKLIVFN